MWAGTYVGGALIAAAMLTGETAFGSTWRDATALWCAVATGMSVYLVDRVKLADRFLDPADARAHPERWSYLYPRRRVVRAVALIAGLSAGAVAAVLSVWLVLVVIGAYVGVLAYAGVPPAPNRPPRRLKDMLVVKNTVVGASIAAFSALLLLAARDLEPASLVAPALILTAIVFADAVMCDLDDVASDAAFGTRTIPVTSSRRAAWITAIATQSLAVGAGLLWRPGPPTAVFALGITTTTGILLAGRPSRVRDLVDARLAMVSLLALAAA